MFSKGLFSVALSPSDQDLILLSKNNVVLANKQVRVSAVRSFLLGFTTANYTLNATVRIARFVADELGFAYAVPTDLSGTESDDAKILPANIAMGIVLLQAFNGLTVDGFPGADFIRKIMGLYQDISFPAHCRAAFMDESVNNSVKLPNGTLVVPPDFKANETEAYAFLRNITLVRNGLWSDRPNIVNLTGLRLEKGPKSIQWDDIIAACWIDSNGRKNAKIYTATTEPGNREAFKTLLPQTIIFVPGYHQGKLPAMRGHRMVTYVPTNKFPERLVYDVNDARGLNLHPGGTTGAMKKLVKYILPVGATNEVEFKAVLVFMEIFEILSRWGLDPEKAAYDNLAGWAAKKALRSGPIKAGQIPVFQDETTAPVKQISIQKARGWLAQKWANDRANLLRILSAVEPGFVAPGNFNTLNTSGLEGIITDKHIAGIVERQCASFFDPKDVDGLAGTTFLSILDVELPEGALAQKANVDFARMTSLLGQFGGNNPILTAARRTYVKQIRTQTLVERKKFAEIEAKMETSGSPINEMVGTWSILCQVVFGPEMFYQMMHFTLQNALQTGQRRWYYTLINEASIGGNI